VVEPWLRGGEPYKYQEKKEEVKLVVKCLLTWCWDGKDGAKVTERFKKWQPVGDVKFYFPIHTVIGKNMAFTVTEVDTIETLARNIQPWTDLCKYEISPCMDSRDLVKLNIGATT
jgi:hypothetical protein